MFIQSFPALILVGFGLMVKLRYFLAHTKAWAPVVVFVIGVAFFVSLVLHQLLKYFQARFIRSPKVWLRQICNSAIAPTMFFCWSTAFVIILFIFQKYWLFPLNFQRIFALLLTITFIWFVLGWKKGLIRALKDEVETALPAGMGHREIDMIEKIITVVAIAITFFGILTAMGMQLKTLLAVGGVGGVTIGFAAKDVVANFFSGFMLYVTQPFYVGQWVSVPSQNIEGHVEEIGWYLTSIRSFEKTPIYVPNAIFANSIIINPSRMTHRRMKETIGIRYQDFPKLLPIVSDLEKMLRSSPDLDQTMTNTVYFSQFGDSALNIDFCVFTTVTEGVKYQKIRERFLVKVAQIIEAHGAQMAFPTMTIDFSESSSILLPKQ